MATLRNPDTGASIESTYCDRDNEKKDPKTGEVTNATQFVLKKGESVEVDEKQARWALKTWPFLLCVDLPEPAVETKEQKKEDRKEGFMPKVAEASSAEDIAPRDDADRFAELKIKGYMNLKGNERDEYNRLKKLTTK